MHDTGREPALSERSESNGDLRFGFTRSSPATRMNLRRLGRVRAARGSPQHSEVPVPFFTRAGVEQRARVYTEHVVTIARGSLVLLEVQTTGICSRWHFSFLWCNDGLTCGDHVALAWHSP